MRPLSQDLRVRFCRALDRGMSARGAARMLEVSAATGVRWAQAWRTRGSTQPGKVGGHLRPFLESERDWLMARIEQNAKIAGIGYPLSYGPEGGAVQGSADWNLEKNRCATSNSPAS